MYVFGVVWNSFESRQHKYLENWGNFALSGALVIFRPPSALRVNVNATRDYFECTRHQRARARSPPSQNAPLPS